MSKKNSRVFALMFAFATVCLSAAFPKGGAEGADAVAAGEMQPVHLTVTHDSQWKTELKSSAAYQKWCELALEAGFELEMIQQPHSNYNEKLNVMFASGDITDIVFDNALIERHKTGMIIPIDEYLAKDEYADLVSMIPEVGWAYVGLLGKTWAVPTVKDVFPYRGDMVRGDWLENLGLDMPETLDDIRKVFHEFTYNDPDGNGQDDTYAASFRKDLSWFDGFLASFGLQPQNDLPCDEVNGKLVCQCTMDKYKEYLGFLRELWTDGVFDPNSFLNSGQQWEEMWQNGKVGYIHHYAYRARTHFTRKTVSISGNQNARWDAVVDGIKGPYGQGAPASSPLGRYLFITTSCEKPESAMGFIKWSFVKNDDQREFLKWGIEGRHYVEMDGKRYRNPAAWTLGDTNEYAKLGTEDMFPKNVNVNFRNLQALDFFLAVDDTDKEWQKAMYGEYGAWVIENLNNYPLDDKLLGKPELEGEDKLPEMRKIILEHTTKIILSNEELDSGFNKMVEQLKNAGLDEMMEARQEWYGQNKS